MSPKDSLTHPLLKLRNPRPADVERALDTEARFNMTVISTETQPALPTLPLHVQIDILRRVLVFEDEKIQVLSRIDSEEPNSLDDLPTDEDGNPHYYHRFHIGTLNTNGTSVRYACNPQHVLSALGVSKLWHVWGCHLFYGLNTFAFSSLGE